MRAFIVPEFGDRGLIGEKPDPVPEAGQLLVRVRTAGVNAMDPGIRAGRIKDWAEHRFPVTPGTDYAGTVEALGDGVSGFQVGDEVFGDVGKPYFGEGSFAELVTVNAGLAAKRPEPLKPELAAALPRAAGTALAAVDALDAKPGDTIVIAGAAGGVGSFATKLGIARGLRVISVTQAQHADYVRSLGASEVIDSATDDLATDIRDVAPDGVAGIVDTYHDVEGLLALTTAVRPGGVIATPAAPGAEAAFAGQSVKAKNVNAAVDRIMELGALAAHGKLDVEVRTMPFRDTALALDRQATRRIRGKLVITIP